MRLWLCLISLGCASPDARLTAAAEAGDPSALTEHLERYPEHAAAWAMLGLRARQDGDHEAAERHYRQALQLDPGRGDAASSLGMLLLMRGDVDGALRLQRQAVTTHGDLAAVQANLAITLYYAREVEASRLAVERARDLGYPRQDELQRVVEGRLEVPGAPVVVEGRL